MGRGGRAAEEVLGPVCEEGTRGGSGSDRNQSSPGSLQLLEILGVGGPAGGACAPRAAGREVARVGTGGLRAPSEPGDWCCTSGRRRPSGTSREPAFELRAPAPAAGRGEPWA